MSFSIILLARAQRELYDAQEWYENKHQGLGDRFIIEVDKALDSIEEHPEHYQLKGRFQREALINVFPYIIVFRISDKGKKVLVSSVFHASRNPKKKYK